MQYLRLFCSDHPWIGGFAPGQALDPVILSRFKQFSKMNTLKKMARIVIAGMLLEEETAGLREIFLAMDMDKSGTITFDELKEGLRKYSTKRYGPRLQDTEIQDLMDAVDVDKSGAIDYGEFIAATLHQNKLEREEHLTAAFAYFDKDRSGYITVNDLQQACKDQNITDVAVEDIIKEVDQNNDGQIDYGEFVAMMRSENVGNLGNDLGRTMQDSLRISTGEPEDGGKH